MCHVLLPPNGPHPIEPALCLVAPPLPLTFPHLGIYFNRRGSQGADVLIFKQLVFLLEDTSRVCMGYCTHSLSAEDEVLAAGVRLVTRRPSQHPARLCDALNEPPSNRLIAFYWLPPFGLLEAELVG